MFFLVRQRERHVSAMNQCKHGPYSSMYERSKTSARTYCGRPLGVMGGVWGYSECYS